MIVQGASEYIVAASPGATFEALREVLDERRLKVVEEDSRHLRLAFQLDRPQAGGQIEARCDTLSVVHGLSKLVVVCVDKADGSIVAPDASLTSLFIQVEHILHAARERQWGSPLPSTGQQTAFALPPLEVG
jgi:hypothetical protein